MNASDFWLNGQNVDKRVVKYYMRLGRGLEWRAMTASRDIKQRNGVHRDNGAKLVSQMHTDTCGGLGAPQVMPIINCKTLHRDVQHHEKITQKYAFGSIISTLRLTQKVHMLSLCCTHAMYFCSLVENFEPQHRGHDS